MPIRTLVCLANSRKPSGRCVAAKELTQAGIGSWIRPVSARPLGELQLTERWYGRPGTEVQPGHIFQMGLLGRRPHVYQTENFAIDPGSHPVYHSTAPWAQIKSCADQVNGELWMNIDSSTYGQNDSIPELFATQVSDSLKLIEVDDLRLKVEVEWPGSSNSKRTVRGLFSLNNFFYKLKITDPLIESTYFAGNDGIYEVGSAIICLSLSEPFGGKVYKLIASVFVKGTAATI